MVTVVHKKLLDDALKIELSQNISDGSACLIKVLFFASGGLTRSRQLQSFPYGGQSHV